MRRMLIAGFILGCVAEGAFLWVAFGRAMVRADTDLTGYIGAAYFPRTEDPGLHALAHERAAFQVAYSGGICADGSLTHDGLRTAEVLACNSTGGAERAVQQWQGSAPHHAILSDPSLDTIGCGSATGNDGATFFACVFGQTEPPPPSAEPVGAARSPKPTSAGSTPASGATPPRVVLPDTRMP